MLHYLKGNLVKKELDRLIIETNGVGFEVLTTFNSLQEYNENEEIKIFTRLIVKDEEMILIGFASTLELEVFDLLRTVSGVGIKSGLSILSTVDLNRLVGAVINEDYSVLTAVSGVGKKTAQRIVIELKDKFIKKYQNLPINPNNDSGMLSIGDASRTSDVRDALISLGYRPQEISQVIAKLDTEAMDVEVLIKQALLMLMKG
jgi:Holliday junction DNA helicase RuvA